MYDASGVRLHAGRQAEVSWRHFPVLSHNFSYIVTILELRSYFAWDNHIDAHLQLLNQIVCELPQEHPLSNIRPLRDSLGHTPLQVFYVTTLLCFCGYYSYFYVSLMLLVVLELNILKILAFIILLHFHVIDVLPLRFYVVAFE